MKTIIIQKYSVSELDILINQLESGMRDLLAQNDMVRANKLDELIGNVIDIRNSK